MCSHFAPVAPVHLLQKMKDQFGPEMLGRYHLVLAHDVAQHQKAWSTVLPEMSTIIIDNSIIELGKPVEAPIMLDALQAFSSKHKRIIVLPDTFDDPLHTTRESRDYRIKMEGVVPKDVEFLYVIQGRTIDQVNVAIRHSNILLQEGIISWIAIPRRIVDNIGTRMYPLLKVLEIKLQYPMLKIHLMGFSNNIQDDTCCARIEGVEGIDSAVPLRLGQRHEVINLTYEGDQAGPRGTFWEDSHQRITVETRLNMQKVRHALATHSDYTPILKTAGL